MWEALIYLLDNIYIRFGTKLYRQIVGIQMRTNCAPLVADLFLFCYERDFMTSLSDVKQGPQYFYTDRSKAVLLLWFLTVLAVCIYTLVQLLC